MLSLISTDADPGKIPGKSAWTVSPESFERTITIGKFSFDFERLTRRSERKGSMNPLIERMIQIHNYPDNAIINSFDVSGCIEKRTTVTYVLDDKNRIEHPRIIDLTYFQKRDTGELLKSDEKNVLLVPTKLIKHAFIIEEEGAKPVRVLPVFGVGGPDHTLNPNDIIGLTYIIGKTELQEEK